MGPGGLIMALAAGAILTSAAGWAQDRVCAPEIARLADWISPGAPVGISGDDLLLADPDDSVDPPGIHVYRDSGTGWEHAQTILRPPGHSSRTFANRMAVDGDLLLTFDGEPFTTEVRAHLFRRDAGGVWSLEQSLPVEGAVQDASDCDLAGDLLVLSDDGDQFSPGKVVTFEHDGVSWTRRPDLVAPDSHPDDRFGSDLSLDSGRLVVDGAPAASSNDEAIWSYVWQGGEWVFEELVATTPDVPDLAQHGGVLAFRPGGYFDPHIEVYRHDGQNWRAEAVLAPPPSTNLGTTVIAGPNRLAIFAWAGEHYGNLSGEVHLYKYDLGAWTHIETIVAEDGYVDQEFGFQIAMEGEFLLCGSGEPPDFPSSTPYYLRDLSQPGQPCLSVEGPEPGIAGAVNRFEIRNGAPGATVYMIAGRHSLPNQAIRVPGCPDTWIWETAGTQVYTITLDANGDGEWVVFAPSAARRFELVVQALQAPGCRLSNAVRFQLQ
ncbi:MAG: hypothetical protein ACF8PN_13275 [Phycisphaerales bacterium]